MPRYYPYIAASLPLLSWGVLAPFSYDRFLQHCEGLLPDEEYALLSALASEAVPGDISCCRGVLGKFNAFETALRNELVRLRAARLHREPQQYLRETSGSDVALAQAAAAAVRALSPLEAERSLDALRWECLEALGAGHFFDRDFLIVYALKLKIALRWKAVSAGLAQELLAQTLS